MLKVENLTKIFNKEKSNKLTSFFKNSKLMKSLKMDDTKAETRAVDNIDLEIPLGKITGLIGFNGSGKSTTYNLMANFIEKFESGKITINGKLVTPEDRLKFSYLAAGSEPQNEMRVSSHLSQISYLYGLDKDEAKKKIAYMSKKLLFDEFISRPIRTLSKGNQQKIKIIAALLNPKLEILILDEPFDGLDPVMVKSVQELFYELKNVTMVLTSHRMEVVQEMCHSFYVMKKGKIVYHKPIGDTSLLVEVNKEVNIDKIKKMPAVKEVSEFKGNWAITIDHIDHFKEINEILIKDEKYLYSSAVYDSLATIVFERYAA